MRREEREEREEREGGREGGEGGRARCSEGVYTLRCTETL